MPVEIIVPPLSQTSDSLLLLGWLKKTGDKVTKGKPLFTVETDKATLDVEAPESGILLEVYAEPQTDIAVRSVIGKILKEGEALPQNSAARQQASLETKEKTSQIEITPAVKKTSAKSRISKRQFASPRARKLAGEKSLDLSLANPSGVRGMVVERDVQKILHKTHSSGESGSAPLSGIRQVIAKRMLQSHLETAPVSYMRETDATNLLALRNLALAGLTSEEIRPTLTDFFIYMVCMALKQHPQLNATFENGQFQTQGAINIALAVDTDRGLFVPVISDANKLTVRQIAKQRKLLVEKALDGSLKPDELTGGTFTLTNLGTLGIDFFTPILNLPQVAILGIGRIREIPAIKDSGIFIRNVVGLSLTCDHRFIDGAPAARFLDTLSELIEKPDKNWSY